MRKLLICLLALTMLLFGCGMDTGSAQTEPMDTAHDHHAPQTRREYLFFKEEYRNEGVEYYLSYNEPDGCVTRIGLLCTNQDKPALFCHNSVFYYIDGYYDSNRQESHGNLKSISFTGETASLMLDGEVKPSAIIRVDDTGVYCEADDGRSYFRVELDVSNMEAVSREDALGK